MGKVGEEQPIPTSVSAQNNEQNAENDCRIKGFVGFRCVFALLLGVAVLLSAIFWLPPFFRHGDPGYLDLASLFRGSDSRLRLWDMESCCNTLVNFDIVRLQTSKAMQLVVSPDSDLAFVPCMSTVKAFGMWSGQTMLSFRNHYDNVNSRWYNEQDQELYTGGSDRQILVWSPFKSNFEHEIKNLQSGFTRLLGSTMVNLEHCLRFH